MTGLHVESERQDALEASPVSTSYTEKRPASAHSRAYLMAAIGFMGIFLFGYDTGVGGAVLVLPSFAGAFGVHGLPGQSKAEAAKRVADLQGNVVAILQGGAFFGALGAAPFTTRFGRKLTLMVGNAIFIAGAVIQTASFSSIGQFYAGRFVAGFGVGVMSMVCPTYASELAPKEIRGRITGMFQVIVVTGVAFSYWINYGVQFMKPTAAQWRIPIGFQLVPVGLMAIFLPFLKESPRWLATKHRDEEAIKNLAWIRKLPVDDHRVQLEYAEISAAILEEERATAGASWREIGAKGNPVRFIIAFVIFTFQQWSGQNSISYYAPQIFKEIGLQGKTTGLLASGVYGLVKIFATGLFVLFGVDRFGRKRPLILGLGLMSMFLWIVGAIFNTHPPVTGSTETSPAAIGMACMIYFFVIPYCFSVGPLPWVICAEIFNNRTRSYGLMTAAATQWIWNFAVSKATPLMVIALPKGGIFFFFAAINMISVCLACLLPETKGISLEAMDVVFGAITKEEREAEVERKARELAVSEKERDLAGIDEMKGENEHFEHVHPSQRV